MPDPPDRCWVELSGENRALGREEVRSILRTLGAGALLPEPAPEPFVPLYGADDPTLAELASRLAHARALYRPLGEGGPLEIAQRLQREGARAARARIRAVSGGSGQEPGSCLRAWGDAYRAGGGRIDLTAPERVFRVVAGAPGAAPYILLEQVRVVDRKALHARRPSSQAFRQPVTLSSRLARTVVNLAEAPAGGTLLDPFCGTGAIPREARLLGYPIIVSDRSAKMLRGTLQNLALAGITPELAGVAEVAELPSLLQGRPPVSAVVTDPPYGRSSSTGGEDWRALLTRLYSSLPTIVRPEGTCVMLLPHPDPGLPPPAGWRGRPLGLAERVHASLSRYVYRLEGPAHPPGMGPPGPSGEGAQARGTPAAPLGR